jgi:hypothetical protein
MADDFYFDDLPEPLRIQTGQDMRRVAKLITVMNSDLIRLRSPLPKGKAIEHDLEELFTHLLNLRIAFIMESFIYEIKE